MSTLFIEKLDKKRQETLKRLTPFFKEFVLAGGTAIMLQIGHRLSYDLDLFGSKPLKSSLLKKCVEIFGKDIEVRVNNSDLLLFSTPDKVQIDFVYFPYPPLHQVKKISFVKLFDIRDLATNKAYTLGRRATWRDYVDLFFLLKWQKLDLKTIIREAEKRFKPEFNEKLFLEQLTYYDDVEVVEVKYLKESYTPEEIKGFLKNKVKDYLSSKLGLQQND